MGLLAFSAIHCSEAPDQAECYYFNPLALFGGKSFNSIESCHFVPDWLPPYRLVYRVEVSE